jgi:aspartate-semialdehyde dehydrogenase
LEKSASVDDVSSAFSSFSGPAQELSLPSAPSKPLFVHSDPFRPQPILDRDLGKGRIVSIGRIRENKVFKNGISYVALGDNHRRGTVGNSIIVCELIAAQEFINE